MVSDGGRRHADMTITGRPSRSEPDSHEGGECKGRGDWDGKKMRDIRIRASVDALCRNGMSEISRDPRTKRLQTRRESLAMPSKHTYNNF